MNDRDYETRKREFLESYPKLDQLVTKLLTGNEADFLFMKPRPQNENDDEPRR